MSEPTPCSKCGGLHHPGDEQACLQNRNTKESGELPVGDFLPTEEVIGVIVPLLKEKGFKGLDEHDFLPGVDFKETRIDTLKGRPSALGGKFGTSETIVLTGKGYGDDDERLRGRALQLIHRGSEGVLNSLEYHTQLGSELDKKEGVEMAQAQLEEIKKDLVNLKRAQEKGDKYFLNVEKTLIGDALDRVEIKLTMLEQMGVDVDELKNETQEMEEKVVNIAGEFV